MRLCTKSREKHSASFVFVFYWGKLLGLNTFKLPEGGRLQRSFLSVVYVIFLSAIFAFSEYGVLNERTALMLPGETPLSVITNYFTLMLEFFEVSLGWLYVLVRQNHVKSILNSFHKIDETFALLEIEYKYERHYSRLALSVVIMNCFCFLRSGSNILLPSSYFVDTDLLIWVGYSFLSIIPLNTVLLFVWIVFVVGSKFRLLNERIKKCTNSSKVSSLRRSGNEAYLEIGENSSHSPLNEIATISRLHRELRNAIHLIEEYFASIILLNSLKQLLTATTCIHIFYRQLKIREQFTVDALVYTVHMSAWWIYPVTMLFVLSNVCGSTTEEANATGNLLHATLVNCRIDSHKIPEFDIFVLELLQNRVTISLLGFVEANYVLVYSMIVTSAGYLTIMLQFYD